ncbi:hypothetical protein [Komagataeibacter oboediens]|uniref:hypothetical protein n=1 Tax=Komagataeibacter oboediens TaxID=65958 RepID=UPI001FCFDA45|nr:hypothetical protein [Komagataeibacter oboediens]
MEGITAARECSVYKARRPSFDRDQIHAMNAEGISPTEIARRQELVARLSIGV